MATFSIVGYDPTEPAWGIAIASRFLAVGARTCWGAPDVGVVVIQAHLNARNGSEGLQLLRKGVPATDVIERLMARDRYRDLRQMAVIDREGCVATYTGAQCRVWAGGLVGRACAAQGNMLVSGRGVEAMVARFEAGAGSLARRLVQALAVGDTAGGDARGRQSAALLVIRPSAEELYDVFSYRNIDLRVDDHPEPVQELSRLLDLYELVHEPTDDSERLPPEPEVVARLQTGLAALGYYNAPVTGTIDEPTREAMGRLVHYHNLRRRVPPDVAWVDRRILAYVEARAQEVEGRTQSRAAP
ncbi:MAG: DUF1028 domain-containing protein [Armatimonadota bacterium]|nr:DUF1028 domain-containing protein [Armatimonadota bacterium]MDR7573791.1 DUF1028 domain-containing protein [Armatimonadota bacterium]MDR7586538.1 DUF1028 domain-containing protein [Armatimonadota bacterium]